MWRSLTAIALGGAIGALVRYGATGVVHRYAGAAFPWGTLTVNAIGSFGLAVVMAVALGTDVLAPLTRTAITVGFFGAFTTFSTFSYESFRMVAQGMWPQALAYVLGSVVTGFVAAWGGWSLAQWVL